MVADLNQPNRNPNLSFQLDLKIILFIFSKLNSHCQMILVMSFLSQSGAELTGFTDSQSIAYSALPSFTGVFEKSS